MENILFQDNLRKALRAETDNRVLTTRSYGAFLYNLLKMKQNRPLDPRHEYEGPARSTIEAKLPSFIMILYNSLDSALGVPSYIADDDSFHAFMKYSILTLTLKVSDHDYLRYRPAMFMLTIDKEEFRVSTQIQLIILLRELYELGKRILTLETNSGPLDQPRISLNSFTVDGQQYTHVIDTTSHFLQVHDSLNRLLMYSDNQMQVYQVGGKKPQLIGVWKLEDQNWVFHFSDDREPFVGRPVTQIDSRVQSEFMLTPVLIQNQLIG